MNVPNIIEALESRTLFKGMFSAPTWRPWLVFLRALFALPLSDDDLAIYRHHTGRQSAPEKAFREAALKCGRRGGKSRVLALVGVFLAAVLDWSAYVAPGETPVVAIIAADRKQARVILGYVIGFLHAVPALAAMIADELAESITLSNGVSIEIHTGSVGAPRGRTFIAVLADEIAFWTTDAGSANPDKEIIAAVRPGLATIPASILLIASSPYARRGVLFDTVSRYYGRDDAPVLVWSGTTQEMNAGIDPRIIEEAYEADPESAAAEYGAEFRTDITAFIGRDAVQAVVAEGMRELPPAAGLVYSAFVDPSGGSADSMTLAIGHMGSDGIAVLDAVRERKPPFSPEDVTEEFSTLLRSYGVTKVQGDAYAGEWPRERFATHGIAYELSARNKSGIYGDFLPALNGRRVRLLDQPRLIAQLCNLERRVSRGGRDSIDHGPGQHDDVANCVCGVLTVIINDQRPALIRAGDFLVEDRAAPLPTVCDTVFATMAADELGRAAIAYWARSRHVGLPLTLVDFDADPLSRNTFRAIRDQLVALTASCRASFPSPGLFTISTLADQAISYDLPATAIDDVIVDPLGLALSAAGHVSASRVKIAPAAHEKSRIHPLGAALDLHANTKENDPLRIAILAGIVMALNDRPTARAA